MTLSRSEVLRLIDGNDITPSRALGQNFVADANTVRRVARLAAVGPGDRVVEVGAGLGSLTLALAGTGASVIAVERDRRLVPVLERVLKEKAPEEAAAAAGAVRVIEADAMHLDWASLLGPERGWALVANLPYNVATPLVADVLDGVPQVERMVLMVQREVGERLVASPGAAAYGAVSVKVAYWAEAVLLGTVPSSVFVPRPRVASALVGIRRRPTPAVDPGLVPAAQLFRVVRAGFAHRRKMLRTALADLGPLGGEGGAGARSGGAVQKALERAGIPGDLRAEQLSMADWGRLAAAVATMGGGGSAGPPA